MESTAANAALFDVVSGGALAAAVAAAAGTAAALDSVLVAGVGAVSLPAVCSGCLPQAHNTEVIAAASAALIAVDVLGITDVFPVIIEW
ncbi:MAG: hypothetical protein C4338_06435 [Rhodanobacteraceae bacterium]